MKKTFLISLVAMLFSVAIFAQPPTPTATCSGDICEGVMTYQASPSNGDYSYDWEYFPLYGDITAIYDQYSASPDVHSSIDAGEIHNTLPARVRYFKSGYGWSDWSNITSGHNYVEPGQPARPSGDSHPATSVPTVYTVPEVDGAFSYVWSIQGGSYSGSSSSNSITLTFYDQFTSYGISVAAWNAGCGQGYGSLTKSITTVF